MSGERPLGLLEVVGLTPPYRTRLGQVRTALAGAPDVPGSRWDLTSLSQFRPRFGPKLWAGRFPIARQALVTNLFNHTPTPIGEGWSVKKTQVQDFRGRGLTYDSHNGTDFSVPVGTTVVAPAPGKVVHVVSEFNRGGLKVYLDHGDGWMTCTAHLARALVAVGDVVGRGTPIAVSGYAGIDGVITFPWGTPHIHFNVWHGVVPVDPFPHAGEVSLWRAGERPRTASPEPLGLFVPSAYDAATVDALIASCRTAARREALQRIEPLWKRAAALISELNYYPTRFPEPRSPYVEVGPRRGFLDLPFAVEEVDGMVFVDEV